MFAYRFNQAKNIVEKVTVPIPEPKEHEVLAQTIGSGLCHTDLHIIMGDFGSVPENVTLGHEGVGKVVKVGPAVTKFKVGDHVGLAWLGSGCLHCKLCLEGKQNICGEKYETGFVANGSHAEYFLADERFAAKLPNNTDVLRYAPILCAGVTSLRAVNRLELTKGSRMVITGANGGLGLMAIQYAKGLGLEVIAVGRMTPEKIDRAKSLGADFIVDSTYAQQNNELVKLISKHSSDEHPVLGALILSPDPNAIQAAIEYVSRGATIVTVILPKKPLELDLITFTVKELTLRSSLVGTPQELQQAVDMMTAGKIVTHITTKPFDKINDAIQELRERTVGGRIVLTLS